MATTYTRKTFEEAGAPAELIIPEGYTDIGLLTFCNAREKIKSVVFPSTMTTLPERLFKDCSRLHSVYFQGSNITVIPKSFFYCCRSLNQVVLPSSLTEIGDEAFMACRSLQAISLPDSLTSIGDQAFKYCDSLQSISIPKGVKKIGDYAFYSCDVLQSVTISIGIREIGKNAFSNCYRIKSIDIPDSVTKIGELAFAHCSLQSVTLPKKLTNISPGVFCGCTALQSITIPNGVKKIGEDAFCGCKSLQSIDLPDGIAKIGNRAFGSCETLKSISIPDGTSEIGQGAFEDCGALKSIILPEGITRIEECTFKNCRALSSLTISQNITEIAKSAFGDCRALKSIVVPDNVTEIGESAFESCMALNSINIPDSVKEIGRRAFFDCNLDKFDAENANFKLAGGILIDKANNTLISAAFRYITNITLPEGIIEIGERAFAKSKSLQSIIFPKSMTTIGYRAFYECKSLQNLILPINISEVGYGAFCDCESLDSVTIKNRDIKLDRWSFGCCRKLTTVNLPKGLSWTKTKDSFEGSPWGEMSPRAAIAAQKAAAEAAVKAAIKVKEDKVRAMSAMAVTYLIKHEFETAFNTETEVAPDSKGFCIKLSFKQGIELKIKLPEVLDLEKIRKFTSKFIEGILLIKNFLESTLIEQIKDDNFINIYVTTMGENYDANIRMDFNSTCTKGGNMVAFKIGGSKLGVFLSKLAQIEQSIMTIDNNVDIKGEYEFGLISGECKLSLNKVISTVSDVRLPSVITEVTRKSFQGCKSLATICLPKTTLISDWPFAGCTNLTYIKLY